MPRVVQYSSKYTAAVYMVHYAQSLRRRVPFQKSKHKLRNGTPTRLPSRRVLVRDRREVKEEW